MCGGGVLADAPTDRHATNGQSVSSILVGLLSFMLGEEITTGGMSVRLPPTRRRATAQRRRRRRRRRTGES